MANDEAHLRHSEAQCRLLVATSMDGVLLTTPDGGILAANEAACRMLGRTEEELVRMGRGGVVDVTDPRLGPALEERARTGRFRGELTFLRADGSTFPAEVSTAVFTDPDGHARTSMVVRDVSERHAAEEQMRASRDELRALTARLQAVREEERAHVAREIHDVLAQDLTRLKIDLVWLAGRLARCRDSECAATLSPRVTEMSRLADETIGTVQRIAADLRPAVLDTLGLCAAIEWHVRDVETRTGLVCRVDLPAEDPPLGRDACTAVFRIVQEALTNVLRHAKATAVDVSLVHDAARVVLVVKDDGCGIAPEAVTSSASIGLSGMRERVRLLGGRLSITGAPDTGTALKVVLPPPRGESSP